MKSKINNEFYNELGSGWYDKDQHPIAVLKAESVQKLSYIRNIFKRENISAPSLILDIGCGAGFITNPLAQEGYHIKGIDISKNSLEVARERAPKTAQITFEQKDASSLSDPDNTYDAVLMMDFLEHVEEPAKFIAEATRVLKPGGFLVFHTFNRTWMSNLLAVKALEYLMPHSPKHIHVYNLFIKPKELVQMGAKLGLIFKDISGIRPRFFSKAFAWSLFHRRIHPKFSFMLTPSLAVGYLGYFQKEV